MENVHNEILLGMARAFFASAWADMAEETGNSQILSGAEILEIMPAVIDPAAKHAARTLALGMIEKHWGDRGVMIEQGLRVLYQRATLCDPAGADRTLSPELFGHYCATQAIGSGVGLESFGHECREFFKIPYVEFGSHSLQKDYF